MVGCGKANQSKQLIRQTIHIILIVVFVCLFFGVGRGWGGFRVGGLMFFLFGFFFCFWGGLVGFFFVL